MLFFVSAFRHFQPYTKRILNPKPLEGKVSGFGVLFGLGFESRSPGFNES